MVEMFVGRMRMNYDEFMETEIRVLFIAWNGFQKQKKEQNDVIRMIICEQTTFMINISGKMVKKDMTLRDFGFDIGPRRVMTKEELKTKVEIANNIVWRV